MCCFVDQRNPKEARRDQTMASWPMDLLMEVFSRLPMKSLLRLKCVSKYWCSIIEHPEFIKLYTNRSIISGSNNLLILRFFSNFYEFAFENDCLDQLVFSELDHPFKNIRQKVGHMITLVGCSNGLICLFSKIERVLLFNPSTRTHKELPFIKPSNLGGVIPESEELTFGFSYLSVEDDYVVVRIAQFRDVTETMVYSWKSNSWREVKARCPYLVHAVPGIASVCINGALYWLTRDTRGASSEYSLVRSILKFDLHRERYSLVDTPPYLYRGDRRSRIADLRELGGSLCSAVHRYELTFVTEVWIMKSVNEVEEDGGHGGVESCVSWTRLFVIQEQLLRPISYSNDCCRVLLQLDRPQEKQFCWYDLKTSTLNRFDFNVITTKPWFTNHGTYLCPGNPFSLGDIRQLDLKLSVYGVKYINVHGDLEGTWT